MQLESKQPQSRRAILAGIAGAAGALAASALGRPRYARAGVDGDVVLNVDNPATALTSITTNYVDAFAATTSGGTGVTGQGFGESGTGVLGRGDGHLSSNSLGVRGEGITGVQGVGVVQGVVGQFSDTNGSGNGTGVVGFCGPTAPAKVKTGVYGYAAQDNTSVGVFGESPRGHGIHGKSTTGFGAYLEGPVLSTKFYELVEIGTPATPRANHARLFIKDNGLGKTQVCVKFANGTVKVLATEG